MKRKFIFLGSFLVVLACICTIFHRQIISLRKNKSIAFDIFSKEANNGIYENNDILWCTFPLSHDLDKGGIPDDLLDVTHPSVCYIKNGWNGYDLWASVTPYPQSIRTWSGEPYENACIFHTNSKETLIEFSPIKRNPIIYKDGAYYNSDSDIFFDIKDSTMYCITRKNYNGKYSIFIQHSRDGNAWSEPEYLFTAKEKFLSPCLVKYKNKYRIYGFNYNKDGDIPKTSTIHIYESELLCPPQFELKKEIKWDNRMNIWHGDILEYDGKLILIECGSPNMKNYLGLNDISKCLYLGISNDGEHFKMHERPLVKSAGGYRSTGFFDDNNFNIYLSFHGKYFHGKYESGHRIGLLQIPIDRINDILDSIK